MASNTIKGAGDVYEKDLYGDLAKSAKEALPLMEKLNEVLKTTTKSNLKLIEAEAEDVEGLKKVNEGVRKINKSFEQKIKLDKERLKLEAKIKAGRTKQQQDNAVLKVQLQAENKARKDLAKETLGLLNAYDKESKRLNTLRKDYKSLLVQQKKGVKLNKAQEKSLRELGKEVKELDKNLKDVDAEAGQFQREVGNYGKATETAKKGISSLSGFLIGTFVGSLNKSRDTSRDLKAGIERLGNVVKVFATSTIELFKNKLIPTFNNFFLSIKSFGLETALFFTDLLPKSINVFGKEIQIQTDKTIKKVKNLKEEISAIEKEIAKNKKTIDESANGFENFADKLEKTDSNIVKMLKAEDDLINKTALLNKEIEILVGQEAVLEAQIGNSTVSFKDRALLIEDLIKVQDKRLSKEKEIAEAEQSIAVLAIKNDLIRRGLSGKFSDEQIKSLSFLKDQAAADAIGLENLSSLTVAVSKLQEIKNTAALQEIENNKERLENARDLFEQELDFTLDIGDRQKTVNEIQIQNDKNVLESRQKLQDDTVELLDSSFNEQVKLTENFIKQSLVINKGLTDEEAAKKVLELNLEKLVLLKDEKEIRKQLFTAGISDEITQNRIKEIIVERKQVLQDVKDTQEVLNESEQDSLDIKKDIAAQEDALSKIVIGNAKDSENAKATLIDLDAKREQDNIDNLTRRLALEKKGSIAFLTIEKELNDALLDQQKNRLEKEDANREKGLAKEKKDAEQRVAIQQALLSKLAEASAKASQKKIDDLDEQLEASKENQDRLRELAAKGSLDAQKSISVEAKKQADLKRAKDKEERKQELVSAGFKIFSALLDQGKNPAAATLETAALLGALPAIIEAIPAFYEGTESTGTVKNALDSNGGRMAMLHDNERVMTEKQNNKMGGIGNDEAANIIEKYNMGELFNYNTPDVGNNLMSSINLNGLNKGLERKIDTLNESIKAIKIPETTVKSDELRNMLIITKKLGNKTETERSKLH
tara:strand:+ start:498 stop:3479 length:2982 start_codon:yes stop_codon:yes gene_type:complete